MADNYIDVPVLVLKVKCGAAVTTGQLLATGADGFINAADSNLAVGAVAMEPTTTSGDYFDAMFIGTAYFAMADSTKAGLEVGYSAAGVMLDVTTARNGVGTLLDGAEDSATAVAIRQYRIFFWGQWGYSDTLWVGG